MTNMMQMQMQWMQQMMQMQGGQAMMQNMPPPPMMMPGGQMPMPPMGPGSMAGPPSSSGNPNMRPMSMSAASMLNVSSPHIDPRTLSMLDPNISTRRTGSPMPNLTSNAFRPQTGYAPSIAPSERSNAGMASRYRPVSVMPDSAQTWGDENRSPSIVNSKPHPNIPRSHLATVTVRPVSRDSRAGAARKSASDDEDDDEAWAEMMKKREKKKSSWKMKRGTSSFADLLPAVH
jgi:hypothetical protein